MWRRSGEEASRLVFIKINWETGVQTEEVPVATGQIARLRDDEVQGSSHLGQEGTQVNRENMIL